MGVFYSFAFISMENQEPEIIEEKLTPENLEKIKKLIEENGVEFDLNTSTIKITDENN